ncbi:MAG: T9SS type A sorting domain-containing protein [Bacteroidetes bacterium]|nr:T9SS type A sorting domain-containing protein [Bacteroidota bacterium]
MFVSAANDCQFFTDKIGMYFSVDSFYSDTGYYFNVTPQVENTSGNILMDTLNWIEVGGYFIAQGGEKYICLGNFSNIQMTLVDSNYNTNGLAPGAYYYIDDISVIDCTASSINEIPALEFQLLNNAARHTLTVTSESISEFTILALDGKKVKSQYYHKEESKIEIDIGSLARGMYLLQVMDKRKRLGYKRFVRW